MQKVNAEGMTVDQGRPNTAIARNGRLAARVPGGPMVADDIVQERLHAEGTLANAEPGGGDAR